MIDNYINPPLGMEVIWEFQELKTSKDDKASRKSKDDKCSIVVHSLCFELISSCSIDRVLQMLNFPHLSIHQEVFNS